MSPSVPFALRRPFLITRDLLQSRADPDVASLERIGDPEAFVWRILPHAARTFAACITLLPAEFARASAVAYLYCRILDTYEDLIPAPAERERTLAAFGGRFAVPDGRPPHPAPPIDGVHARDQRDRAHVVLVNRCHLLDAVFRTLTPHVREDIAELVQSMAEGMIWSSRAFAEQQGVLRDADQLSRYCRCVIGLPFLFGVRLLHERRTGSSTVPDALREDCLQAGEMVQLANVTRDIEKDLRRGIAYHPALAADLGRADVDDAALAGRIRRVREELLLRALRLAPAYERMMAALPFRRVSLARASGVLMLQFTDRYYRSCAARVGRRPWPGPRSTLSLILRSAPHFVSARWAARTVRGITAAFVSSAGN
ncbi:MAG: squalene/phytoene synthase family protein [Gemmatimonadales bacterium]